MCIAFLHREMLSANHYLPVARQRPHFLNGSRRLRRACASPSRDGHSVHRARHQPIGRKAQLANVGVTLVPAAAELCFTPSWTEVQFGSSWVRNMFD